MENLVSIVLPTYNGEKFLRQSIDSCLHQTYKNIELIVVNDCSTDQTEEIILSYNDSRLVYHKNTTNQKLPNSLNIGFSLAKGDYLSWTSDDNYYHPEAIEKMVNVMETGQDLVYAPYWTIDDANQITGERMVGKKEEILLDNVVKACFLYRKEVKEKVGEYNPNLFLVEDYDYWVRIAFKDFKFKSLDEKLYYYRFHEGSLTETRRKQISEALYFSLKNWASEFNKAGKSQFLNANVYLKLGKLAVGVENQKVKSYLWKASFQNPLLIFSNEWVKTFMKSIYN